jgi:glycerol-3-phosphate O-acyltransferase|tara:strand:- start:1166 stop:2575 length:1410 start_codon:yes stop_codon:yes gene_type:complete
MNAYVEVPVWALLILICASGYAVIASFLLPGVRWVVRRRLNRTIATLNTRLQIQIRPFQRTKRQVLIDRLAYDSQVIDQIESIANSRAVSRESIQARVYNYAKEIAPAFNAYVYFRIGYWIAKRVSRFLYRVRVSAADQDKLIDVDPDATVVFVMNHRSNIDYLLVSYLVADQVTLSYAVGEWARIFPLQPLLKAMGAFFVRRKSDDALYRKVLERYVYMATQEGVSQAVYLEGGLSRDGSMGTPKLGFLDYMLRHFNDTEGQDIVFVPIAINYDHVLEDLNLLATTVGDRQGGWFHTTNFLRFLRDNLFIGVRRRWRKFGYASVNFGIPVSARDYCRHNGVHFNRLAKADRFVQVQKLADELMGAIRHVMPILPIPLICTVLLESRSESLKSLDILSRVDRLIDQLISRGAAMKVSEKPRNRTLMESLELLKVRGILQENNDSYEVNPLSLNLLEYYANSIAHFARAE